MANLVDVLKEKNEKGFSLGIGEANPNKYNNLIARLNSGAIPERDPNFSLNTQAASNGGKYSSAPKTP